MRRPNTAKSHVRRGMDAAKVRSEGDRRRPGGPWFATLTAAVRADREERGLPPDLTEQEILYWADAFRARTGEWPTATSGEIPGSRGESWLLVEAALELGLRGFCPGRTLARFFAEHRGEPDRQDQRLGKKQQKRKVRRGPTRPPFSIQGILRWADLHRDRHGRWPTAKSGKIHDAPGETWGGVDRALIAGRRGLPGGFTYAELLRDERGVPHPKDITRLTDEMILAWADAFRARTGKWPKPGSGRIPESPGDTWAKIQLALSRGCRGLRGASSLFQLIAAHPERRRVKKPDLTIPQILAWADAFQARHGRWPNRSSGPIPDAPGETWNIVSIALWAGLRGLPGGSSIPRLLADHRGFPYRLNRPQLTITQIMTWADAFRAQTGRWPKFRSGPIPEASGETWRSVNWALRVGNRGVPGGSSLHRLLNQERRAK